jgi:hypothetical protein
VTGERRVRRGGAAWRRGFAMPVVVLLALVASIMAAVLLEREDAESRLAQREVNGYRDRHFERGLREVIGSWSNSLAGHPVEKMTGPDGHIMNLVLPDGSGAAIYMFDGQGSLLSDATGLSSKERDDLAGVMAELRKIGGSADGSWFRAVGPLQVCAQSAPQEILEAIGNYAGGGKGGRRFAMQLVSARGDGDLKASDLNAAMESAQIEPRNRETINRLLVAKPDLRAIVVDVYETKPGRRAELARRYGGRLILPGGQGQATPTAMVSLGRFLSWEELPLGE